MRVIINGAPRSRHADPGPGPTDTGRPGLVLACVCTCTVLVVGLVAAINLAVPLLAACDLHPDAAQLLWMVDAYVVVFACLVIPGGAVGDRYGRKGALIGGLLVFAAGGAITALAPTVAVMLAGRTVTGLGAALVLPNGVGVLVHATPPARRVRALALWGAVTGMGGLVGNTAGGALLDTGTWQALFRAVVPCALACALWAALVVRRSDRSPRSLDPAGTGLLVAATVALLVGIIEGPEQGWGGRVVVGAFVASALLGAAWVTTERRVRHPLLDPRLFRLPRLTGAALGMLVMFFGCFGLFYLNASLLEYGRTYGVLVTGLAVLPLSVPLAVGARFVPALADRIGFAATLAGGFACIGGGLYGLTTAVHRPYPVYAAWLVLIGIGFALGLPVLTAELTAALPADQAGVAGGLQSATRELGSALGVAVVGTVLTSAFARNLPPGLRHLRPVPRTVAEATAAAPGRHGAIVDAFVAGAGTALHAAAVVTALAGVIVVVLVTRPAPHASDRPAARSPRSR